MKTFKRRVLILLTSAIICIICGGLITFFTSQTFTATISPQHPTFTHPKLPFSIQYQTFDVEYLPGTPTPKQYLTKFYLIDKKGIHLQQVQLNKICRYKGYKIYPQSYQIEQKQTKLLIKYDYWGTFFVYIGYLLIIILLIYLLWAPQGEFRKRMNRFYYILLPLLIFTPSIGHSQHTISHAEADAIRDVTILHQGRLAPFESYARQFLKYLYGKEHYHKYDAVQTVMGQLLYPEDWQQTPIIKTPKKSKLPKFISYQQLQNIDINSLPLSHKEKNELKEKQLLFQEWQSGELFLVFPKNSQWVPPLSYVDSTLTQAELFRSMLLPLLRQNNTLTNIKLIQSLKQLQQNENGIAIPPAWQYKIEIWYHQSHLFLITLYSTFIISLINTLLSLRLRKNKRIITILIGITLGIQLLHIISQTLIQHHFPISNTSETLQLMGVFLLLLGFLYRKKSYWHLGGIWLSAICLLNALLFAPKIPHTPLAPILASPWLAAHVTLIMASYTLFIFHFMLNLLQWGDKKQAFEYYNQARLLLYPALLLLALGIIVGSLWANLSWGRYWGWDIKECCALITLLLYSLLLVIGGNTQRLKYERWLSIIAFACICFTYIGVNFLGIGIHAYGG